MGFLVLLRKRKVPQFTMLPHFDLNASWSHVREVIVGGKVIVDFRLPTDSLPLFFLAQDNFLGILRQFLPKKRKACYRNSSILNSQLFPPLMQSV